MTTSRPRLVWYIGIPVAFVLGSWVGSASASPVLGSAVAVVIAVTTTWMVLRDRDPRRSVRSTEEFDERLKALEERGHQAETLEEILGSMPQGVLLIGHDGLVEYSNPAARELLGRALSLPPTVGDENVQEFVVRYPSKRELRATTVPLRTQGRLVVVHDVTESKRVEAMRKDFVADASHELKTPVAGILASAETADVSAADDPSSVKRFTGSLVREARRLSELVEDLLDLARLEQEQPPPAPVQLSDVILQEVERMRADAEAKGLGLDLSIQDVEVSGSANDLMLAIRNLLDNAIRYTESGKVHVSVHEEAGEAVVTVSDTGAGIPERDLARVFERFYRVDKARSRETGGTGLGLSIVRHIAERHGGRVVAESTLGQGSKFVLTLPSTHAEPEVAK